MKIPADYYSHFRVEITDDSDHDPKDIYDKNQSLLDSEFDEWGILEDTWGKK